ncbi:MAG TPA: PAS domain-containing sensor histidine kinase [Parafilimonas sp.]|nr:PAS domain-containing sensor histidine kinase [Parafilimonas sp.]
MHESKSDTSGHLYSFEALFNYATIGIIVTDEKGAISNFNKQAKNDFGYTKEEVLGKPIEILIPPSLKTKHEQYREGYYRNPTPRAMGHGRDLFAQKKDGSVFPVEVSLSNYTINDKLFVIAFVVDITVRKEHESVAVKQKDELERVTTQIKQLNTNLEKKVEERTQMLRETLTALEKSKHELSEALETEKDLGELKSRFVSMASHEFKTPLSTILSSSYLLEKYNDLSEPAKRAKHIVRIKNAVNDMKLILDDFLSLDKLDEGLIKSNIETLSAEDCFSEIKIVISEMQVNLKPGQQITFEYIGEKNVVLDKHLLKNICINLLSNAIKFSPENSVIKVGCLITEKDFILSIKDTGIGISEEDKQHLFERFFRAKNAFNIQGTGLGLHIVGKYLELMNGTIKIESGLNQGSAFTIHIPQQA